MDITSIAGAIVNPAYNGRLTLRPAGVPYSPNPLEGRAAYARKNTGWPLYDSTTINFGKVLQGKIIQVRFGVTTDANTGLYGWEIDNVSLRGINNSPFGSIVADQGNCTQETAGAWIPEEAPMFNTVDTDFQAQ